MSHDARQMLEVMIRTGQGGALAWSTEKVQQALDAYRDQVATDIGRDALRDGLHPLLVRLVGEPDAQRLLAAHRAQILREAADFLPYDAPLRTDLGPYMDVILHRVADFLRRMAATEPADARIPTCYVQFMGGAHCATPPVAGQQAEAQPDAVYPPRERWYVEYLFTSGSEPWWGVAQGPHTSREQALAEKESRRPLRRRRIVRETTTWTVEEDPRG